MGFVLSKFRKKKPSIKESLEKIDKELKKIQRFQVDTELQQKRIIGRLLIFSSIAYLIFAAGFYLFAPSGLGWKQQIIYALPFVLFPLLMWIMKRLISWWYERKIVRNKEKTESMRKEKQRLLDEVMEKETFNVAKEILEKYAPSHLIPKYMAEQQRMMGMGSPISSRGTPGSGSFQEGLRRRQQTVGAASTPMITGGQTPRMIRPAFGPHSGQLFRQPSNTFMRPGNPAIMPAPTPGGPNPGIAPRMIVPNPLYMLPLPPANPIVHSRNMGWMEKLVDYVVGDGAASRYALICRYCATHNGLATPEDFPYIGYRCVFCRQYNPARQVRPSAPTLPKNTVLFEEMDNTAKSENSIATAITEGEVKSPDSNQQIEESKEDGDRSPIVDLPTSSTEGSLKSDNDDVDVPMDEEDDQMLDGEESSQNSQNVEDKVNLPTRDMDLNITNEESPIVPDSMNSEKDEATPLLASEGAEGGTLSWGDGSEAVSELNE